MCECVSGGVEREDFLSTSRNTHYNNASVTTTFARVVSFRSVPFLSFLSFLSFVSFRWGVWRRRKRRERRNRNKKKQKEKHTAYYLRHTTHAYYTKNYPYPTSYFLLRRKPRENDRQPICHCYTHCILHTNYPTSLLR